MVDRDAVRAWIDGYVRAWNSNERDDIVRLFTEDARYLTEPHAQPWVGHDGIVEGWLDSKDEPGDTTFEFDVLAVEGPLAIVEGRDPIQGQRQALFEPLGDQLRRRRPRHQLCRMVDGTLETG